jgi:hypothetical protein
MNYIPKLNIFQTVGKMKVVFRGIKVDSYLTTFIAWTIICFSHEYSKHIV